jgi:hypothetical protein
VRLRGTIRKSSGSSAYWIWRSRGRSGSLGIGARLVYSAYILSLSPEFIYGFANFDRLHKADLAFTPWDHIIPKILGDEFETVNEATYPNYWAWHKRIEARPAVQKVLALKAEAVAAGRH